MEISPISHTGQAPAALAAPDRPPAGEPAANAPPPAPVAHRKSCVDARHSLYEVFTAYCNGAQLPLVQPCNHPAAVARLETLKRTHINRWETWVLRTASLELTYIAGSGARFVAGAELFHQQFGFLAHRLPRHLHGEVYAAMDLLDFTYNDVDLHFSINLSNNPTLDLATLEAKLLAALPDDVEQFCPPLRLVNKLVDKSDPSGRRVTLIKLQLREKLTGRRVDLIFEPKGNPERLFGADDLTLYMASDVPYPLLCSSDAYAYFEGQLFRVLNRKEKFDPTAQRRLEISRTQGYWAAPALRASCREASLGIELERRAELAGYSRDAHLPAGGLARIVHQVAYQMEWGLEPLPPIASGHLLTELLDLSRAKPHLARAAEALLHVIVLIALLEDHQGELTASVRGGELEARFPGGCSLWFARDVGPALALLKAVSTEDFHELRPLLKRMHQWTPCTSVNRDYADSVHRALVGLPYTTYPQLLEGSACELVQLRLQAALVDYGGPPCVRRAAFWREALRTDSLSHLRIRQEMHSRHVRPAATAIDGMLRALCLEPSAGLCEQVANWLIELHEPRAVEFLRMLEPQANIDWSAIATAIEREDPPVTVQRQLSCQRLIAGCYQAVPRAELAELLVHIDDVGALGRLAGELMNADDPELYRLGLKTAERIGSVDHRRLVPELLSTEQLARYTLAKQLPLTESVMERLLAAPQTLTLREQVGLVQRYTQRYTGPQSQQFWRLVATRLSYEPGSWPEQWRGMPDIDPQAQVLWTGVVHAVQQQELAKAVASAKALIGKRLGKPIEPPGGRVALMTRFHHMGVGTQLAEAMGEPADLQELLDRSIDQVCLALRYCDGEFRGGDDRFGGRIIEHCLNTQQDPWPLWEKLKRCALTDALRTRWILQEANARRVCELLPGYSRGSPLLAHVRKRGIIRELLADRRTHPWVYALLLDGPLVDWPSEQLTPIVLELIRQGPMPRQFELIALYGEKLQEYTQIWKRVVSTDETSATKFTAVWLAQGIPLDCVKELYLSPARSSNSLEVLLDHCLDTDAIDCALELWRKLPCIKERQFYGFCRKLMMKSDDPALAEWALTRFRGDADVVLRAATLISDADTLLRVLYPALARFKLNGQQGAIADVVIRHLQPSKINAELVMVLCKAGLSVESGRLLAEKCLANGLTPDTTGFALRVLGQVYETHGVWHAELWAPIHDAYLHDAARPSILRECAETLEMLLDAGWTYRALSEAENWLLVQIYSLIADSPEQKERAKRYWEEALRLTQIARSFRLTSFLKIFAPQGEPVESARAMVRRMAERQWISDTDAAILELVLQARELEDAEYNEGIADRYVTHCARVVELHPHFAAAGNRLCPFEKPGDRNRLRLLISIVGPVYLAVIKIARQDDAAARRIAVASHDILKVPEICASGMFDFLMHGYFKEFEHTKPPFPAWWMDCAMPIMETVFRPENNTRHTLVSFAVTMALACEPPPEAVLQRLALFTDIVFKQDTHLTEGDLSTVAITCILTGRLPRDFQKHFPSDKTRHAILRRSLETLRSLCDVIDGRRYEELRDRAFRVVSQVISLDIRTSSADNDLLWMGVCEVLVIGAPDERKHEAMICLGEFMFSEANKPLFDRVDQPSVKTRKSSRELAQEALQLCLMETVNERRAARTEVRRASVAMTERGWLTVKQAKTSAAKLKILKGKK